MFRIVLVAPEIPPNTGNVIRLAANTGCELHLVRPLGFELDDKQLRRAGLDYHEYANLKVHENFDALLNREGIDQSQMYAFTTRGSRLLGDTRFTSGSWLVFGSETAGLPAALRDSFAAENRVRLPLRPNNRSLNLSNAVAVAVYEAWRQHGYAGGS